jgi:hypothetical protein
MSVRAPRRTAKAETVKVWRERSLGLVPGPRGGQSLFMPEDLSFVLTAIVDAVAEAKGLNNLDQLLTTEAAELIGIVRSAYVAPPEPEPYRDPPAEVARYVSGVRGIKIELPESWEGRQEVREVEMIARYALEHGRAELDASKRAEISAAVRANPDVPVESLHVPGPPTPPPGRGKLNLGQLGEKETGELELLIEKALGVEPGSVFEERRKARSFRDQMEEIMAPLRPAPKKRRVHEEPGTGFLPPGLYVDLLRADGEKTWMTGNGIAAFALVSLTLEGRRLHPAVEQVGRFARFEAGGGTLAVFQGFSAWGAAAPGFEFSQGLADCARMRWLTVVHGADHWTRISYGPKMVAWLAARREEA